MGEREFVRLSNPQRAALGYVSEIAGRRRDRERRRIAEVLRAAHCSEGTFQATAEQIRRDARVVLHFHPDRICADQMSVVEALLRGGQYSNQFVSGLSSGSLTAFPGGPRDRWEQTLFGGAYHEASFNGSERPKYGALELVRHPDGPWPRFGSCYFILKPQVIARTTFTFSGSEQPAASERVGVIDALDGVMAPLLEEVLGGEGARVPWPPFFAPTLGVAEASVTGFLERIYRDLSGPRPPASSGPPGRVLDSGIEAQVHGPIELQCDVEQLVADPVFEGRTIGRTLEKVCAQYSIALGWHRGFRMLARDVPADFRGPAVPELASRIAADGIIDAAVLGSAEASLRSEPDDWADLGSLEELFQYVKQLWHVLVHYGAPA